jgi:hypothetical protein
MENRKAQWKSLAIIISVFLTIAYVAISAAINLSLISSASHIVKAAATKSPQSYRALGFLMHQKTSYFMVMHVLPKCTVDVNDQNTGKLLPGEDSAIRAISYRGRPQLQRCHLVFEFRPASHLENLCHSCHIH